MRRIGGWGGGVEVSESGGFGERTGRRSVGREVATR